MYIILENINASNALLIEARRDFISAFKPIL